MNITHRRNSYQAGSLTTETRSNGVDVYIFRWRVAIGNGKSKQHKIVLGTVKELTKHRRSEKPANFDGRRLIQILSRLAKQ